MRKEPLILEADDQNKIELSLEDTSSSLIFKKKILVVLLECVEYFCCVDYATYAIGPRN